MYSISRKFTYFMFLLVFLFFLFKSLFGENYVIIKGKIIDSDTGVGIDRAKVYFINEGTGDTLITFSDSNGNYSIQLTITKISGEENNGLIPKKYRLYQNYPNPFNPGTVIEFELPEPGRVKIVVYDLLGKVVKVLTDREYPEGISRVCWDGTDEFGRYVSAGVYFYRMKAGEFTDSRKMVLLDEGGDRKISGKGAKALASASMAISSRTIIQNVFTIRVEKTGYYLFVEKGFVVSLQDTVIEKNIVLYNKITCDIWTAENSPYVMDSTLVIEEGRTLVIEPGVTVAFKSWWSKLIVKGKLIACGTESDSIRFTSYEDPESHWISWGGVEFDSCDSETRLEYCLFEKITGKDFVILCDNSSPTFSHIKFSLCDVLVETGGSTIQCINNSFPAIEYSVFSGGSYEFSCISCATLRDSFINRSSSNPRIFNNDFYIYEGGYAVCGGGFLDMNYIEIVNWPNPPIIDTSLGDPVDEVGDGIFTTNSRSCKNVDGITNPRARPHFANHR
ncbi:MAG: T9SS type A sorting domain-containing protein [Candidatus Marinimicrobia bacterium]|nr:T9SS type A sorting domain-containing protein [Candidatus Neomarinimicrobiota bacterium]